MTKNFSFLGPDGQKHSFEMPHFEAGSVPPSGYVLCDCGQRHDVFKTEFDHGVRLGEFKPKQLTKEDAYRTFKYFFSFRDEKVHEMFPGPKNL